MRLPHLCSCLVALICLGLPSLTSAQNMAQKILEGAVIDSVSAQPLPFSTIVVLNSTLGTTSDQAGEFSLSISPEALGADSLEVSYMGYNSQRLSIADFQPGQRVWLSPTSAMLKPLVVRPISAEDYLRTVQRKQRQNFTLHSFNSVAHYNEVVTENGAKIEHNEGIFKNWHSAYQSKAETHHQLALYKRDELADLNFMKKKAQKSREKYLKKHPEEAENMEDQQALLTSFGGPAKIIQLNIYSTAFDALDSTKQKRFEYQYASSSSYMGRPVIVINYQTRGQVNDRRGSGTIYIDSSTDAVVSIVESGTLSIPLLAKPILFAMGIKVGKPAYNIALKHRMVNNIWYPQHMHWQIDLGVKKTRLFGENESGQFKIAQSFDLTDIMTEGVKHIEAPYRFDPEKKMSEQVFPISGLTW